MIGMQIIMRMNIKYPDIKYDPINEGHYTVLSVEHKDED